MLKIFYRIVTPWAVSNKLQKFVNRVMGKMANAIYPFFCKFDIFPRGRNIKREKQIIVSLTSFPARMDKLHLCVNSILRQSVPADKVVLWLAKDQFQSKDILPQELLALERKGLTIEFCEDLRSYKKFFYAGQKYCDDIIITADDDVLYPEDWIERLYDEYNKYDNYVICYRAAKMEFETQRTFKPYAEWEGMSPNLKGPSSYLLPTGVGGVLYPPNYFKGIEFNYDEMNRTCPNADDIWLKSVGIRKSIKAVKVDACSKEWFTISNSQKKALTTNNVFGGNNDFALKNIIIEYNITEADFN